MPNAIHARFAASLPETHCDYPHAYAWPLAAYCRGWNAGRSYVSASRTEEQARIRALRTVHRVVRRMQRALLAAGWSSWHGTVWAAAEAEAEAARAAKQGGAKKA